MSSDRQTTATPESVGMSSDRLARVHPVMESYVAERGVVGISTLVSRRGEVVHAAQFGHQDREADVAMSADTIFRIYSMTKPVVSTALMMLHEEGAFQLDQPVAKYLPAFFGTQVREADGSLVDQARPMQIRDLLTHTSGLTYDFMMDNEVAGLYREARIMNDAGRSLEAVIDALAAIPLAFQPGSRWQNRLGERPRSCCSTNTTPSPGGRWFALAVVSSRVRWLNNRSVSSCRSGSSHRSAWSTPGSGLRHRRSIDCQRCTVCLTWWDGTITAVN
jgi:hypothetical protein